MLNVRSNPQSTSKPKYYDIRCFGEGFGSRLEQPNPSLKTGQKLLNPSVDQVKSMRSENMGDFDLHENSISLDTEHHFHINTLKANCPSFHFVKSSNTVETADTQFSANQSISYLDIPSERAHNRIFTTYGDYQEYKRSALKTEESLRNILLFKTTRSLSAQPKSRAASRYKDCSSEFRPREFATCSSIRHSRNFSREIVTSDFHLSQFDIEPKKSPPVTPRLGTTCSLASVPVMTQESTAPIKKEVKRKNSLASHVEDKRSPVENTKQIQEDLTQVKENFRSKILQLKKKIKDEETKKCEVISNTQLWKNEISKMDKKLESIEKKGHTTRTQAHNIRKEVLGMLEQNDLLKTETANLKERSLAEQKVILSLQDEIKRLKILLAAENKERDKLKGVVEKSRRLLTKTSSTLESLEQDMQMYRTTLAENNS